MVAETTTVKPRKVGRAVGNIDLLPVGIADGQAVATSQHASISGLQRPKLVVAEGLFERAAGFHRQAAILTIILDESSIRSVSNVSHLRSDRTLRIRAAETNPIAGDNSAVRVNYSSAATN